MKKSQIKDFEELQVWKDSQTLSVEIYRLFSSCRDRSFVDQIKRASVSISNNIAEGYDRGSNVDFARFLDISKGSCSEVRSMLKLAERLGYIENGDSHVFSENCVSISKQLAGFAVYLRKH